MSAFDQEALDRASWELQRHFGREGSIYGIKACEEIARIALVAYGVPEALRITETPVAWRRVYEDGSYDVAQGKWRESDHADTKRWRVEPLFAASPRGKQ